MLTAKAFVSALALGIIFSGCAAIGVPATNDPDKKIGYAYSYSIGSKGRCRRSALIREAIAIHQEKNNDLGLAEAYRAYGFFFRSAAVKKWHQMLMIARASFER